MTRPLSSTIFFTFLSLLAPVGCITYPFLIRWRFDLDLPENKAEYDWFVTYVMPWNFITLWAWFMASKNDPGYLTKDNFLPLPAKMDKVDKVTMDNLVNTPECQKCAKKGRPGVHKVEFVSHCSNCDRCVYEMDHHCVWLDNCAGKKNMKAFLLFSTYISIFSLVSAYHMTQMCWPKFNEKGHGIRTIHEIWQNRLNPKVWELDIFYNYWGIFDTFWFSANSVTVLIGIATASRQVQMLAEWASPVSVLKGHIRPYRGV
jgi:hypothetical protein